MNIYNLIKNDLRKTAEENNLLNEKISVKCRALSVKEAIGDTEHDDYPIVKGKEVMVQADFKGSKGQAFSDEFETKEYTVKEIIELELDNNKNRASFISSLNAIYRHLEKCDKTIHCKDNEPLECAKKLDEIISPYGKILLIGFQPRFCEYISSKKELRVLDIDKDNIEKNKFGVIVESPEKLEEAIDWCDMISATGSTIVNGTIEEFIDAEKPKIFYGITISAAASILNLKTWCKEGH